MQRWLKEKKTKQNLHIWKNTGSSSKDSFHRLHAKCASHVTGTQRENDDEAYVYTLEETTWSKIPRPETEAVFLLFLL